MTHLDISGQKFGRLTALSRWPTSGRRGCWLFVCECGTEKVIALSGVRLGRVKSCGCLHMERCRSGANRRKHGDAAVGRVTRLHNVWRGMLKRCNPSSTAKTSVNYAGRGITVCSEWASYLTFKEWALGAGYTDELTLDRIDNDGPYSPENCRWAARQQQARNRRTSRHLTINGKTQVLAAWAEEMGVSQRLISVRLGRGWSPERAVTTPI